MKEEQVSVAAPYCATVDGDVYKCRAPHPPFDVVPRTAYFYYVNPSRVEVKHYKYMTADTDIEKRYINNLIKFLVRNARNNDVDLPQYGADWNHMVWTHKSYIIVFVDDAGKNPTANRAISVDYSQFNYSFSDAWEEPVQMLDLNGQPAVFRAICCINHMKKNFAGENLDLEQQKVKFNLHIDDMDHMDRRLFPGTGGTNMGPPAPPPLFGMVPSVAA